MQTDISESTRQIYLKKALTLRRHVVRSQGGSLHGLSALQLVDYLAWRQTHYSKASWRLYRNALRYELEMLLEQPEIDSYCLEDATGALWQLQQLSPERCQKKGRHTSANKSKQIRSEDLRSIVDYLHRHPHRYADLLHLMILATLHTGLRPCEWQHATLVLRDDKPMLRVRNAKATQGRGLGVERLLDLSALGQEERQQIAALIENIHLHSESLSYASLQKALTDYMHKVTRACLGKRKNYPTLYSLRHQFSANAKASGLTRQEVAALMGHASDETAGSHYGRRTSGNAAIAVRPLAEQVAKVRCKATEHHGATPHPSR